MRTVIVAVCAAIISLTSLGTGPAKAAAAAGALTARPVQGDGSLIVNVRRRDGARRGIRSSRRGVGRRSIRRRAVRRARSANRRSLRRRSVRRYVRRSARRSARRGNRIRRGRLHRRYVPRRRHSRRIVRYGFYAAPALSYYSYSAYPRRCAWLRRKWRRTGSRYWRRRLNRCMARYYW